VAQPSAQKERIGVRFLEDEMRESFIDYSMSVIVQRALPDARDGLKPVHRRILYAMWEAGLLPDREHKKSATVVGDVLGKYHPHGDSAVYDTLVRMAQDFSMRYPLVDGQGNFGSVDGDAAAAYRYTEARLTDFATELLEDLGQDTVAFKDNFDGRLEEPAVLPTRLPQLLLNGTDGIAVGMATKIPPHNLGELLDAAGHLVREPDCEVGELATYLEGPDFPTGGYIWGRDGIRDAYRTGRGLVEMRARMHVEEGNYGKSSIVVTELPYQVNKTRVIEQITRQVKRGRLSGVTDLRDESDRDGIRLVIELKRDTDPRKLLKPLFKKTQLRYTFGVITLALVDGKPEELDLKEALGCYVDHRLEVIERRAAHRLRDAEDRIHVVEGLLVALDDIGLGLARRRTRGAPGRARPQRAAGAGDPRHAAGAADRAGAPEARGGACGAPVDDRGAPDPRRGGGRAPRPAGRGAGGAEPALRGPAAHRDPGRRRRVPPALRRRDRGHPGHADAPRLREGAAGARRYRDGRRRGDGGAAERLRPAGGALPGAGDAAGGDPRRQRARAGAGRPAAGDPELARAPARRVPGAPWSRWPTSRRSASSSR